MLLFSLEPRLSYPLWKGLAMANNMIRRTRHASVIETALASISLEPLREQGILELTMAKWKNPPEVHTYFGDRISVIGLAPVKCCSLAHRNSDGGVSSPVYKYISRSRW